MIIVLKQALEVITRKFIIVLASLGLIAYMPLFIGCEGHKAPNVREPSFDLLLGCVTGEEYVCHYVTWQWGVDEFVKRGDQPGILEALVAAAEDTDTEKYFFTTLANYALFRLHDKPDERFAQIIDQIHSSNGDCFYIYALAWDLKPEDAKYVPQIMELLQSENWEVVDYTIKALGQFLDEPGVLDTLIVCMQSSNLEIRGNVGIILKDGIIKNPALVENEELQDVFIRYLHDKELRVEYYTWQALSCFKGNEKIISELLQIFHNNPSDIMQIKALRTLSEIAPAQRVLPLAISILDGPTLDLQYAGREIIWKLTIKKFWPWLLAALMLVVGLLILRRRRLSHVPEPIGDISDDKVRGADT